MGDNLPKQKRLISISEAAKVLGVSIDTVRRWDKSGVLHSERPDGKNRYFSLDELEKHKFCQPLSISEAAITLGISPTTLRRLEERGLLKPERNSAGERVYDKELLKNFLNSNYFLGKKQLEKKIIEPLQEEVENDPVEIPHLLTEKKEVRANLKPWQRIPELLAAAVMFFLLMTIGITNISAPVVQSPVAFIFSGKSTAPAVLSQTTEAKLSPTPTATAEAKPGLSPETVAIASDEAEINDPAETKPMEIVTVIFEDKSSVANIRKEATTSARIIGKAPNGSSYELVSKTTDWYKVKLVDGSIGFISAKYIWREEGNN